MTNFGDFFNSLSPQEKGKNEPRVPPILGDSFVSIGTPGMRVAPEILVLELMREIFYERPVAIGTSTNMNPHDLQGASLEEIVTLEAARGRIRRAANVGAKPYYMPLYPEQARNAALRKNTDRVLRNNFLQGPLTHCFHCRGEETLKPVLDGLVDALHGRARGTLARRPDLMVLPMRPDLGSLEAAGYNKIAVAKESLHAVVRNGQFFRLPLGEVDALALRITNDLYELCKVEGHIPRLLWLDLLKTFLRISTGIWLLAQARLTIILRDEILRALTVENLPSAGYFDRLIKDRSRGLIKPLSTPSLGLHEHVIDYGKARVETSLLMYLLREAGTDLLDRTLKLEAGGAREIGLEEIPIEFQNKRETLASLAAPHDAVTQLRRLCERYPMWRRPTAYGQSKNLDEFLRVLWCLDVEDNDEGFIARRVRGAGNALLIFPGSGATKLMAFLADRGRVSSNGEAQKRRLLLEDLEAHYDAYGIDFSSVVGARPRLIEQLSSLGLLRGSPDAGSGAWLNTPLAVTG
jgi:hypothetical protein